MQTIGSDPAADNPSGAGTVLVVEDHPLVRMTTVEIVREAGMAVIEAGNADDALRVLSTRNDVRAIFTDVDMPGTMNGLELAALIRHRWPAIQAVVTSGGPAPGRSNLPNGVAFYEKPYDHAAVVAALRRLVSSG